MDDHLQNRRKYQIWNRFLDVIRQKSEYKLNPNSIGGGKSPFSMKKSANNNKTALIKQIPLSHDNTNTTRVK